MIDFIGKSVSWLTLFMAGTTFAVVVLRYAFDIGSIPLQESVMYMHGALFMLGLAYTLKHDAHVRVDLLYSRFTPRGKDWVNLGGHCFFLIPVCAAILLTSWEYAFKSWELLEGSPEVGGIRGVFILKSLIPVAACLLILQALLEIGQIIKRLFRGSDD